VLDGATAPGGQSSYPKVDLKLVLAAYQGRHKGCGGYPLAVPSGPSSGHFA